MTRDASSLVAPVWLNSMLIHELTRPIATIAMLAENLSVSTPPGTALSEAVTRITGQARAASELLEAVGVFSTSPGRTVPFDLLRVLRASLRLAPFLAEAHAQQTSCVPKLSGRPLIVQGDPREIAARILHSLSAMPANTSIGIFRRRKDVVVKFGVELDTAPCLVFTRASKARQTSR